MRQAEVVNLTKDAVDLGAGMLTLTTTRPTVCAGIYINAALAVVLRGTMARSPGPYVFTNTAGEPYTCDGVRTLFRRAVAKAEIEDFHFHDLRHTTATRLRQQARARRGGGRARTYHADDGPAVCPPWRRHDASRHGPATGDSGGRLGATGRIAGDGDPRCVSLTDRRRRDRWPVVRELGRPFTLAERLVALQLRGHQTGGQPLPLAGGSSAREAFPRDPRG